jgi:hypothetical protein
MDYAQAEPRPFSGRLRRDEGFENTAQDFRGDPTAVVGEP